ncbi:MAG: class III lanthionine synthetase LanKC [Nocardioidaceae bacterium]
MDKGHEGFCLTDQFFYDSPTLARDDDVDFDTAQVPVPVGWTREELDDWLVYTPNDLHVPLQGWKIHSSASLADAEKILQVVWDYCIPRGIAFKFVRSSQLLLLANGKYAHRGSSGKFVTIYPSDDLEFETILTELGVALAGFEGPYILSDVRWGDGPLYVRYGAFAERYCLSESGDVTPAIEDASGELVPDRRGATFSVPSWVTVPGFLEPALTARSAAGLGDLPYRIERPLHFSNGGGVYAAIDTRTDEAVVLKEARPHAGLAIDKTDAVARLENERDVLERLAGLDVVPGVRDYFTLGGHHFLVIDFVEGVPLGSTMADWYPLVLLGDDRPFAAYTDWAVEMLGRVRDAVSQVHAQGVVIGDLHPNNILVGTSGEVVLIDLEIATDVTAGVRSPLGDPGFAAPSDRIGFDIDEYALACLEMSMFLPLTELFNLDESKIGQFADEIAATFPLPPGFLERAVGVITERSDIEAGASPAAPAWPTGDVAAAWPALRESMTTAILASATPERDDRLFPGDIAQFVSGGLNLAYGAAGVLLALHATGAGRHLDHEDWLVSRACNPTPGSHLGFYDGLHGVAYALDCLGRRHDALEVLSICTRALEGVWEDLGPDLFSGRAGIGLNLAHFAHITNDPMLWAAAAEVAESIADGLGEVADVPVLSGKGGSHAGLLRGSTGPALLFIRLYEHFGDEQLLDLAAVALRQDLRRCVVRDDGALEVNEGYRTMPYLYDGSIGIGMVIDEFLAHRHDDDLAEASAAARVAPLADFYIEPGLFSGRAGMIAYLSRNRATSTEADSAVVASHIRRLAWHAVGYGGGVAFPGDELMRLSMDLATGTAGVLYAVGAALHDAPVCLPFLGSPFANRSTRTEGGE